MTPFGIASLVLQIVPASDNAGGSENLGVRDADDDFLIHLQEAMRRRDAAAESLNARADERRAAKSEDDSPHGEAVSATAHDERKRHSDSVEGDDDPAASTDPVDEGQSTADASETEETTKPATDDEAAAEPAADDDSGEGTQAATAADDADPEAGNATIEENPAVAGIDADPEQALATTEPAEETTELVADTDEDVHAAAEEDGDGQVATAPLDDAGEVLATTATSSTDDTDGTTSDPALTVLPTGSQSNTDDPTLTLASDGTGQVLAAPATGDPEAATGTTGAAPEADMVLASAAAGTNPDAAAAKGDNEPKTSGSKNSQRPGIVLTPKSDGEVKRPQESGAVRVSPAFDGDAAAQSKSKGFTPTVSPGAQTSQAPQSGLPNALAMVTANHGAEANSVFKLNGLLEGSVATQAGKAGTQGSNAASTTAAPPPQAVAAGLATPQGLTNAANQANPLRAPTPPPPPPNPAAFQVAVNVTRALNDGLDQIKIRLHPANLGRVDVKLEVAPDGRVSALVTADKAETLDLLQRDKGALERALQEAGLQTDSQSLNFGLRGDQAHSEDSKSNGGKGGSGADDLDDELAASGPIPPTRPLTAQAGALDIWV